MDERDGEGADGDLVCFQKRMDALTEHHREHSVHGGTGPSVSEQTMLGQPVSSNKEEIERGNVELASGVVIILNALKLQFDRRADILEKQF